MLTNDNTLSYRPHNSGHDYHDRGIYLITLVVRGREKLLGRLNDDLQQPGVELSTLGCMVQEEWEKTPAIQAQRGNRVRLLAQVVMPDHWHGVIAVDERLDKSVGAIIQATKSACTVIYRKMCGIAVQPSSDGSQPSLVARQQLSHMSPHQRAAYYATLPKEERPLFDDNYDDTICLEKGYPLIHLQKEPIGAYWKPERSRFEAAERGSLLILSPWNITIAADSDYSQFHNMNTLAAEICAFDIKKTSTPVKVLGMIGQYTDVHKKVNNGRLG